MRHPLYGLTWRRPGNFYNRPVTWHRVARNIAKETELDRGGHFAAWPELLTKDLEQYPDNGRPAYETLQGKIAYECH